MFIAKAAAVKRRRVCRLGIGEGCLEVVPSTRAGSVISVGPLLSCACRVTIGALHSPHVTHQPPPSPAPILGGGARRSSFGLGSDRHVRCSESRAPCRMKAAADWSTTLAR